MSILKRLTESIREIANIDAHIDTEAAERSIRNNIEFKGPNAWILAVAIIIAPFPFGSELQILPYQILPVIISVIPSKHLG